MENYLISIPKKESLTAGTIHDLDSKLKVKAFDLLDSKFIPRKGELRFFVTAREETLAFETEGYQKHRKILILQMIARYCMYLGLQEAQIHANRPAA
jgi:hypothetical protein